MQKTFHFISQNCCRCWLVVVFTCLVPSIGLGQIAPAIQWDRTFGGNETDVLTAVQQTADGGYILGGLSDTGQNGDKSNPPKGNFDFWIIKLNAGGVKLWDKTFGGSAKDILTSLQQTADGGFILGGHSTSGVSGDKSQPNYGPVNTPDYWIIKLDSAGNKVWDKTLGGTKTDELVVIKQTSDGGYILGGRSDSDIGGDKSEAPRYMLSDFWIVKLDAAGNKLWDKTYGGTNEEEVQEIVQTTDGGYLVGGYSTSGNDGDKTQWLFGMFDFWVIKLDANGNKQWDNAFGCGHTDYLSSLQQTPDGGYILGGHIYASALNCSRSALDKGLFDYWLIKLDPSGNLQWEKILGSPGSDFLTSLKKTPDGGFIMAGYSNGSIGGDKTAPGFGMEDIWVVKTDSLGNKLWDKTLGGSNSESSFNHNRISVVFATIQLTSDNGFIVGTHSNSGSSGNKTQAGKGKFDYWIVKLAPEVLEIADEISDTGFSIFPNPSQGNFNLQISNFNAQSAEIIISDLLGKVVLKKNLEPTANKFTEQINLPVGKGMYLLQIKTGNQSITRKILVE